MDGEFRTKTLKKADRGVDSKNLSNILHENKKIAISWKVFRKIKTELWTQIGRTKGR
jgi:hypothetical protein